MKNEILIERYKYIVARKTALNENTFKVAGLYQAIMIVILGCQFQILEKQHEGKIDAALTELGSWGLAWMSAATSVFCALFLIGGIFSWFDYRNEEAIIEKTHGGLEGRAPSFKGIFRWYETYIIIMVLSAAAAYFVALHYLLRAPVI